MEMGTRNMLVDVCESRLTVHIACHNLRNMDTPVIGRSDPFALLFLDNTGASTRPAAPNQQTLAPGQELNTTSAILHANADDNGPGRPAGRAVARNSSYQGRDDRWERVGATETVRNSHNAIFATSFEIPYFFERAQRIAVDVFDRDVQDSRDDQLHLHDFLGGAELSVPALVRARNQRLTVPLRIPSRPGFRCGTVTVAVEEVSERKQRISYTAVIDGLPRRRGVGPFITISRRLAGASTNLSNDVDALRKQASPRRTEAHVPGDPIAKKGGKTPDDDGWRPVFRSHHAFPQGRRYVINNLSHNYEKLCRCDDDVPLRFDISFERSGRHHVFATETTTLRAAEAANGVIPLSSVDGVCCLPSRVTLTLSDRRVTEDVTFLDYIIGGCEISLVIAIDFTASNGDPSQRGSLHFCDSLEPNEYETAIRSVGDILGCYDTDQAFPVFGFGAKLPPNYSHPSHLFSLTEDSIVDGVIDSREHFCYTIDGVLNAYRHALYNVRLSGPTVFSDIVQAAADHSRTEARDNDQAYTILLVITDGVINDVDATLESLFQASSLPISVVIIGVGDRDFTDMKLLDGDDMGRERDIVQFVNYRHFKDTPEVLRAHVLEEIPQQFLQYMKQRNIKPLPLPEEDEDD